MINKYTDMDFLGATIISLIANIVFTMVALFAGLLAIKLVDIIIFKKLDIQDELKKNNIAVAIFASSMLLFIANLLSYSSFFLHLLIHNHLYWL